MYVYIYKYKYIYWERVCVYVYVKGEREFWVHDGLPMAAVCSSVGETTAREGILEEEEEREVKTSVYKNIICI